MNDSNTNLNPDPDCEPFPRPASRLRVVFVCYGNACRSQMAEAYARARGQDVLEAASAGISPLGHIPPEVGVVMAEEGISLDGQTSKDMQDIKQGPIDLILDLSGLLHPAEGGITVISRPVYDPYGGDLEDYRKSRDAVRIVVEALLHDLRRQKPAPPE